MRRVVWTAWAVVYGLLFLLVFVTKFNDLFSVALISLVLTAVGCVACLTLARQAVVRN